LQASSTDYEHVYLHKAAQKRKNSTKTAIYITQPSLHIHQRRGTLDYMAGKN